MFILKLSNFGTPINLYNARIKKILKSREEISLIATKTIDNEAKAIENLKKFINSDFLEVVNLICRNKGRVIITGVGKSAIIANKIVATLNSTGTPSIFMHAADAIHGDLGIIQKEDIVICISKSGNTPEIKVLVPLLKDWGNKLVALVGNIDSYLAKNADYILNSTIEEEACPNNLAPTTSTTAQMVIGDALAVCLLSCNNFSKEDFARYHPGGSLGKQLYLKVENIYLHNAVPKVQCTDNLRTVIMEISSKRLGATAVLEGDNLAGVITDGDLRRMLEKNESFPSFQAKDIMNTSPKTIEKETMAVDALQLMKKHNINQLLVVEGNQYLGIIHLHDLIREGIF